MVNGDGSPKVLRFLCCRMWDTTYCLNMSWVRGIRRTDELQHQRNDHGLVGWLTSDHEKIPVFRLTTLLNRSFDESGREGKILVLNTQPHPWGLLVESVESVIQVTAAEVFPLPTLARNPAADVFKGVVKHQDKMLLVLAPESLHPAAPAKTIRALPTEHTLETLYSVADISARPGTRSKVIVFSTTPDQAITFGLSLSQVPQILRPLPIPPVPGTASDVLGLIEWRGVPLAVIDLSRRLGGAASPVTTDSRLLIARASTQRACFGLPIRPQVHIHNLPIPHQVTDRPVPLQESLIRGKFALEHTTLVIPDLDALLAPNRESPDCRGARC
jgi:chemotaxis signal transduction protein